MRIVHFSDIHAACWISEFRGFFDKRILGAFNFLLRRKYCHNWNLVGRAVTRIRELSPDVVVCTGDLATLSEEKEFELAKTALSPLVQDVRFDFIYVPGNHDYYLDTPKCKRLLEKTFSYMNRELLQLNDLPTHRDIGHTRFLLVNEAKPSPFYASSGAIDAKTNTWLASQLKERKLTHQKTILIGHYPLFDEHGNELSWRRRCWNSSILQSALRDRSISVSLCGHIHSHFVRWEKSGSVEVCAGSLTKNGMINMIDYKSEDSRIHQQWINVCR